MKSLKVSVVIPTRNRSDVLKGALDSLLAQELPMEQFEVIVSDNGSTDSTEELCQAYSSNFANFQYLFVPRPGLHEGRHAGLRAARAPLITYADDDIIAFPSWLRCVVEGFQDSRVSLVGGKNVPKWESAPPHWIWEKWATSRVRWGQRLGHLSLIDFGDSPCEIDPVYVYGCNFSIRKSVLLAAGGFHPDGMPQDLIEYRGDGESYVSFYVADSEGVALYHPGASVYHCVPTSRMTQDYFQRRSFNQGVSDSFTEIRRVGKPREPEQSSRWRRMMAKVFSNNLLRRDIIRLQEQLELSEVDRAMTRSYRLGFDFHQARCICEPKLLEWVLRPNYLEG